MPKKYNPPDGHSWCSLCRKFLPVDQFDRNAKRGCDGYCRECRKEKYLRTTKCKPRIIPPHGKTLCGRCREIKDNSAFSPGQLIPAKGRKNKRSAYCKRCIYERSISDAPPLKKARHSDNHQCFKKTIDNISIDRLELAYAAGLFDAEGTATLKGTGSSTPHISVANNNAVILERMKSIVGGNIKYHDKEKIFKSGISAVVSEGYLRVTNILGCRRICEALLPFLILKKKRCELVIQASRMSPQERRRLRPLMKELNRKCVTEFPVLPNSVNATPSDVAAVGEVDFAYLAGMIDGDGWIGFRYGKPDIHVSVSKYCILSHLYDVFKGSIYPSKNKEKHKATKFIWRPLWSREAWRVVLPKLSQFMTLKKRNAELSLEAIDRTKEEQDAIIAEIKGLTAFSKLEKFQRVENQLPEFEKRLIRDENGIITGLRDTYLEEEKEPEWVDF